MTIRQKACCQLGLLAGGFALAASALPLKLPSVCLFKRITGCPCCACGMTHAFCALARGHIAQAESFHIASVPLACAVVVGAMLLVAEVVCNRRFLAPTWKKTSDGLIRLTIILLLVGWCVNLQAHFAGHDPLPHALAFSTR